MDIAELGLSVRSDGVAVASGRLDGMTAASRRAEKATERLIRRTKKMGSAATRYLTLPLIAAGTASIKMALDFETSMTKMVTLVGLTRKEVAAFKQEILALGPAVGKGPTELAEALFSITSAGQRGVKAMATLTMAAKASAVGMGETRTVALASVAAVQAYGEANLSTAKSMEILIGTVEQGNLEAASLAPVLGRVIGVAAELGVSFEDVGAFIATFSRLGVDAAESTTALRGVLSGLIKATPQTEAAFEKMGTSVSQFRDEIENDGFTVAFQGLVKHARLLGVDISELIPDVRALSGVLGVFGGEGDTAIQVLAGVSGAVGTLEKRFKSVQELDPAFQMAQFKAELQSLGIEIGANIMPAFLEFVRSLKDVVGWLRELSPEAKTVAKNLALITFVGGPLLIFFSKFITALQVLNPLLVATGTKMSVLLGPAGLLVAALVALAAYALDVKDEFDLLKTESDRLAGSLGDVTKALQVTTSTQDSVFQLERLREQWLHNTAAIEANKDILDMLAKQGKTTGVEVGAVRGAISRLTADTVAVKEQMVVARDKILGFEGAVKSTTEVIEKATVASKGVTTVLQLTSEEIAALTTWWAALRAEIDPVAEATRVYEESVKSLNLAIANGVTPVEDQIAAMAKLREIRDEASSNTDLMDWWSDLSDAIDPVAAATKHYQSEVIKLNKAIKKDPTIDRAKALAFLQKQMEESIKSTENWTERWGDLKAAIDPVEASMQQFTAALEEMNAVRKEMESGGTFLGQAYWDEMESGLSRAILGTENLGEKLERAGSLAGEALRGIQSSMTDGSKAYEAMNVAIQAANVVSAIGAVINQGSTGDPYTAFARMAAMASAVAALGVSVGNFGGGFADTAAKRQEAQGTGSVLGDAEAKSESILNSMDITASSTSELVGINRGMLRALTSLEAGLSGASSALARNPQGSSFSNLPNVSKIFGGKSKVSDEGIAVIAGTLNQAIDGVLIKAFQEVKFKKWIFGKKKTREELIDLGDEASVQIGLVFQAIGDSVREGALALGLGAAEIQRSMELFKIEEMRISLKDLSASEAEAELQAVFSKIFDDLAASVVPFIEQFQLVGEGMGETLIRVATSVQVTEEAIKQLGLSVDETDPEKFALLAVSLVELTGGIDEFISKFQNFVSKFATEEYKMEIITRDLTRGFASVGLSVPATAEELWKLMQSLDATTEEGREQIAMILELTDHASTYYDLLDEAERKRLSLLHEIERDRLAQLEKEALLREETLNAEVNALLNIQAIAEGVVSILGSLKDSIITDLSTDEENYNRYKAEAEKLALDLRSMEDPEKIRETVAEIERLSRLAYGLLDDEQSQAMGQDFLTFLNGVEELALERLRLAADTALENTALTPEEVLNRFDELVTNPLILVAQLQEFAAQQMLAAALALLDVPGSGFGISAPPGAALGVGPENGLGFNAPAGTQLGVGPGLGYGLLAPAGSPVGVGPYPTGVNGPTPVAPPPAVGTGPVEVVIVGPTPSPSPSPYPIDQVVIAKAISEGLAGASRETVSAITQSLANVHINVNLPEGSLVNE